MAEKRSSALPPLASMHTRSFAATSIRRDSYSANCFCNASCRPFEAMPCALRSRRFCMSALLLRDVSSCRIGSTSSCISATSLVRPWMRSCTLCSTAFTASTLPSTSPARRLRTSTSSCPASFDSTSASASTPCTLGSSSFSSPISTMHVSDSSPFFSMTMAMRFSASSLSFFSCSSRWARLTQPLSSSRAMPTAVFSKWKSSKPRPCFPIWNSCLQIRSRLSFGRSKLNSSFEYLTTSSRLRTPSPSWSYWLKRAAFFCARFVEAIFLAMRSLLSLARWSASVACRVAAWMRGCRDAIWLVASTRMLSASSMTERFCERKSAHAEQADMAVLPACSTARPMRRTSTFSSSCSPASGAAV
mmetsp:Transcript_4854/g.14319  ORF Transcript_4854/g.14319 Transcript_4854/m.14319 type:complete len:360 (-) Transcript_4854:1576-2655(-)